MFLFLYVMTSYLLATAVCSSLWANRSTKTEKNSQYLIVVSACTSNVISLTSFLKCNRWAMMARCCYYCRCWRRREYCRRFSNSRGRSRASWLCARPKLNASDREPDRFLGCASKWRTDLRSGRDYCHTERLWIDS